MKSKLFAVRTADGRILAYFPNKREAKAFRDEDRANRFVTRGPDHYRGVRK